MYLIFIIKYYDKSILNANFLGPFSERTVNTSVSLICIYRCTCRFANPFNRGVSEIGFDSPHCGKRSSSRTRPYW